MGGATLEDTVRELAEILVADASFADTLRRIAELSCQITSSAVGAEVTLGGGGGRPPQDARAAVGSTGDGAAGDTLTVPLVASGVTLGTIVLHAREAGAFTAADAADAEVFAAQAAVVLANARAYWDIHEVASGLQAAMRSRAVIEQAKGKLTVLEGCTADEAFTLLARTSQRDNVKLRELARLIMEDEYRDELARG